jgi:hypothetical protein
MGTALQQSIFDMYGDLLKEQNFEHPLWSLSPFIDVMSDNYNYRFDWEREWRVPSGLHFEMDDVAFLLLPDGVESIRADFKYLRVPPVFLSNGPEGLAYAPEELGDETDHLVAIFGERFSEPNEILLFDSESPSGYSWPVRQWETEDAVDETFPGIDEAGRTVLVRELDAISSEWVNLSEWHEMGE